MDSDKIAEIVAEIRNALTPITVALEMPNDRDMLADARSSVPRVLELLEQLAPFRRLQPPGD